MLKMRIAGLMGALVGAVIGEFFPKLFKNDISNLGDDLFGGPFFHYRNHLAVEYALGGVVLGILLGLIWDGGLKQKKNG